MESYLYYRIGKQLLWFANEVRDVQENEQMLSRLLVGSLLAAIAVVVFHAFHLAGAPTAGEEIGSATTWGVLIGTLSIMLPPLGTAFVGIRAMYNFRDRSRIYAHEKGLLHIHRGALEALIQQARQMPVAAAGQHLSRIDFDFRAIALRTEQSLSVELSQWALLMERREPEVGP